MIRLLRWMVLLFGILLMALTAGVLIFRRGGSMPEVILVASRPDPNGPARLSMVMWHDGDQIAHSIGDQRSGVERLGMSPDDEWLYLREIEYRKQPSPSYEITTLRVRLAGMTVEQLPKQLIIPNTLYWTPDGQWMVYKGAAALFRASPDGTVIQNLTPQISPSPLSGRVFDPILSPDNDWVAFSALAANNDIYVVDVESGRQTQVTSSSYFGYLHGHVRNATGDWLIISMFDGAYRVRLDGTQLTRLLPKEPIVADIVSVWPEARILLVWRDRAEDALYALNMDDFSILWTIPNSYDAIWQPKQPYRIVIGDGVFQVFPDGSRRKLESLPPSTQYHFSADGTTVFFKQVEGPPTRGAITDVLYSLNLSDDQAHPVFVSDSRLDFYEWASGAGWFLLEQSGNPGPRLWRVWEQTGRCDPLIQMGPYDGYLGMGYLRQVVFDGLVLLSCGGIAVLAGFYGMIQGRNA